MEKYRIKDSIRAVKFDSDGHGELTMLSPGCVVQLRNGTPLQGFVEVIYEGEPLRVFRQDLAERSEGIRQAPADSAEEP